MEPIAIDRTAIEVKGDKIGAIFWRGKQWAVTQDGIECLDGTYFIGKSRLLEGLGEHSWLDQLAEKTWVDSDEFCTCWMVAVLFHGFGGKVNSAILTAAVESMWSSNAERD